MASQNPRHSHREGTSTLPGLTALHSQGAAMSKVGLADGLPRRGTGRLVALLVLLPLPLNVQGSSQVPAFSSEGVRRRKVGTRGLPPKHLHPK